MAVSVKARIGVPARLSAVSRGERPAARPAFVFTGTGTGYRVIFAHDETAPTTFYFQLTAKVCAFPTT